MVIEKSDEFDNEISLPSIAKVQNDGIQEWKWHLVNNKLIVTKKILFP